MEKQAKALDDSPKHCQKSMGFGIREVGSHCFCNPAARPLSLKFSHVEKGYNTHLTVVVWHGCEGNHVRGQCLLNSLLLNRKSQNKTQLDFPAEVSGPRLLLIKSILSESFHQFHVLQWKPLEAWGPVAEARRSN